MTALTAPGCSYALLADGTTITIRPARPDDFAQVKRLHDEMSPDNLYLRFFSLSRNAAEQEARRVTRAAGPPEGSPPGSQHGSRHGALRDALLRVSQLADDLPELSELDLNPVIACADGATVVDATVRVSAHAAADPFLRQLPQARPASI